MRGDVDGYVAEFNPTPRSARRLHTLVQRLHGNPKQIWRLVGNGRITLDPKKRLPMYQNLNKLLMTELLEIGARSRSRSSRS